MEPTRVTPTLSPLKDPAPKYGPVVEYIGPENVVPAVVSIVETYQSGFWSGP